MNVTKCLSVSRSMRPIVNGVRNLSVSSGLKSKSISPYNDDFFGSGGSNMMRNFQREFDNMKRQMDRNFRELGGLSKYLSPIDNFREQDEMNKYLSPMNTTQNDQIVEDKDGKRKFQISFSLKGYQPENIKVKTRGQNLIISAKTEKDVSLNKPIKNN